LIAGPLDSFLWVGQGINRIGLPGRNGNNLILDQFSGTIGIEKKR
jgi:hypothetical protein